MVRSPQLFSWYSNDATGIGCYWTPVSRRGARACADPPEHRLRRSGFLLLALECCSKSFSSDLFLIVVLGCSEHSFSFFSTKNFRRPTYHISNRNKLSPFTPRLRTKYPHRNESSAFCVPGINRGTNW